MYLTAVPPSAGLLSEPLKPARVALLTKLGYMPCPNTLTRYFTTGLPLPNGTVAVLEGVKVGGKWFTSFAAVERFIARQQIGPAVPATDYRQPATRAMAAEAAGEQLRLMGC